MNSMVRSFLALLLLVLTAAAQGPTLPLDTRFIMSHFAEYEEFRLVSLVGG